MKDGSYAVLLNAGGSGQNWKEEIERSGNHRCNLTIECYLPLMTHQAFEDQTQVKLMWHFSSQEQVFEFNRSYLNR